MKKQVVIAVAVVALLGAWYAFRPEKLFTTEKVSETFPTTTAASSAPMPVTFAAGRFHAVAHDGQGVATVYQLPDGKRVVRLSEFKTSNGPQLHLYLTTAADATDSDTIKNSEILDLGPLKGNEGDQNYDVPAGADLSKFKSATVWCARFNVNFTTAPLTPGGIATAATSSGQPVSVATGKFHAVAHEGQGNASIYQLPEGKQVLRLSDFKTSNGPKLHLYLVAAPDATDDATVKKAGFLDLGPLKGNEGDQNYDVPAGTDLNKYKAVTVWCARFNVNFTTAPLVRQ